MTERYADELVGEMENFGQWSDGSNSVSYTSFYNPIIKSIVKFFYIDHSFYVL